MVFFSNLCPSRGVGAARGDGRASVARTAVLRHATAAAVVPRDGDAGDAGGGALRHVGGRGYLLPRGTLVEAAGRCWRLHWIYSSEFGSLRRSQGYMGWGVILKARPRSVDAWPKPEDWRS